MRAHDELPEEVGSTEENDASARDKARTESGGLSDRRGFLKKAYGAAATVGLANFFVLGSRGAYADPLDCPNGQGVLSGGSDACGQPEDDYCPGGMDKYDVCAADGGDGDECPGNTDLADKCSPKNGDGDECSAVPTEDECNVAPGSPPDNCNPTATPANPDECVNGENGEGTKDTCDDGGDATDECPGGKGAADLCAPGNDEETDQCPGRINANDQCDGSVEDDQCDDADAETADVCPLEAKPEDGCTGPTTADKCGSGDVSTDECPADAPASDVCVEKWDDNNDECANPAISGSDLE